MKPEKTMETAQPRQLSQLSGPQRALWQRMGPLPEGLVLYGGTALTLYLAHRCSYDLDFVTLNGRVEQETLEQIPWLVPYRIAGGGPGMFDVIHDPENSALPMTFLEAGRMMAHPTRPPKRAENGLAVAHPIDLVITKLHACTGRGALRDYQDLAEIERHWPGTMVPAAAALEAQGLEVRSSLLRALADPPSDVRKSLSSTDLACLADCAQALLAETAPAVEPSPHPDLSEPSP